MTNELCQKCNNKQLQWKSEKFFWKCMNCRAIFSPKNKTFLCYDKYHDLYNSGGFIIQYPDKKLICKISDNELSLFDLEKSAIFWWQHLKGNKKIEIYKENIAKQLGIKSGITIKTRLDGK